ncbi:MAG: di-trans,poly-cis-decaprenylcistransferase [Nitrospirae bacterium]|nr:di-trans,poly-cis-decaprenylcistransferase [Nitrospirota bacterium]
MNLKHVAIIMDGNGRWAELRGLSRIEGHREGIKRVREIIDASIKLNLKALTLYVFSMENWQRPKKEVSALMELLVLYLKSEMRKFAKDNVVFRAIGDLEKFPVAIQKMLKEFESGEMRLSNFLLWQAAYSEFYFTETLWPDFGKKEFLSAVAEYTKRERRFGTVPSKPR